MPHLTSTAGRHAADRARERAAEAAAEAKQLIDENARESLRRALNGHGIRALDVLRDGEHTLSARCSVDACARDSALIEAIATDHGFRLDPGRLSRFNERFEHLRLLQPATGAKVSLLISRPGALHHHVGEAA